MLTATFEDAPGGKTKLILRHAGVPNEMLEATTAGWSQSLDKFAEALASLAPSRAEAGKHKLAA